MMYGIIHIVRDKPSTELQDALKRFDEWFDVPDDADIWTFVKAARKYANLTEQTRTVMGQDDDGTPNGKDYTERRLVSEWTVRPSGIPKDPQ